MCLTHEPQYLDIGGNFIHGFMPSRTGTYTLHIALATNSNPDNEVFGVQLREQDRPLGWIRDHDLPPIRDLLRNGNSIIARVVEISPFWWKDEACCWGRVEWKTMAC